MKDFKVLQFLDRFRTVFEKAGVQYDIMRRILQIRLIMDGRRVPSAINRSSKNRGDSDNNFMKSLWIYGLIGIILVPMVLMGKNYIFQMSFVFGILMFMVMTSLISDFSAVLLDIRDKNIIASKPVTHRTLSVAKALHIFIYMFFLTISISGAALLAGLIKHGVIFFILFLVQIILMDLFIVILTALLYLLILKFFDGEKLKDIINYVQIALTIGITVGYQLLGRVFSFVNLNIVFSPKWWQYFIAPLWFGASFEVLLHKNFSLYYVIFSILAICIPIISIIIYIKLIPTFEKNLQKLNNNSGVSKKSREKFFIEIGKLVCRNKTESTFFRFSSNLMKNERQFKLKVYPSLGFAMIFPFIFMMNELRESGFAEIAASKMYLNIYLCAMMLPTVIMMMGYSGSYKGAWVYKVMPHMEISSIFKGTIKAFLAKLLLPVYLIESIIFIGIFGFRIFPDLILVFLNMMIYTVLCFKLMKKILPFSESFSAAQDGNGLIIIPLMLLLGVFAGIHFVSTMFNWGIYVNLVVSIIINILAWKKAFCIPLEKLNRY